MRSPIGYSVRQTVVTVTAGADIVLVQANPMRKDLRLMNIGTGDATLGFGSGVTAGQGWPLNAADAAGRQGGGLTYEASGVTTQEIHARSTAGTTIVVLEGV